jgi:hypothetical protein
MTQIGFYKVVKRGEIHIGAWSGVFEKAHRETHVHTDLSTEKTCSQSASILVLELGECECREVEVRFRERILYSGGGWGEKAAGFHERIHSVMSISLAATRR